jgi:tetratricopeptide (TPR) repeat protein
VSPTSLLHWFGATPTGRHTVLWSLVVAFVVLSPASPAALTVADGALALGHAEFAASRYEAIGVQNPISSLRRRALRRAAEVWSLELDRPDSARDALHALLDLGGESAELEQAHSTLGRLHERAGEHAQAGQHFETAAGLAHGEHSAALLVRAAECAAAAGQRTQALARWSRLVRQHPAFRSVGNLGRAELRLAEGSAAEALVLYRDASTHAPDALLRDVAQLGVTSCLERLGRLDEALAAIEATEELPADLRAERALGLRARSERKVAPPR